MTIEENRKKIKAWIEESFKNFDSDSSASIVPASLISKQEPRNDMTNLMNEMGHEVDDNYNRRNSVVALG